jgi:hypothetical protein
LVCSVPVCMAVTPAIYSNSHTVHSTVQCTTAAVTWYKMQSNALQQQSHDAQRSPIHYNSSHMAQNAVQCTTAAVTQHTAQPNTLQQQSHNAQCSPMYYSSSHTTHNAVQCPTAANGAQHSPICYNSSHTAHNAVQCTTAAVTRHTMQCNMSLHTAPITFYKCFFYNSSLVLFFQEACNYGKVIWNHKAETA